MFSPKGPWFFLLVTCVANIGEFSSVQAFLHYRQGSASIQRAFRTWLNSQSRVSAWPTCSYRSNMQNCKSSLAPCVSRLSISCPAHQLHPSNPDQISSQCPSRSGLFTLRKSFQHCHRLRIHMSGYDEANVLITAFQQGSPDGCNSHVIFCASERRQIDPGKCHITPNRKHLHLTCFSN